MFCFLLLAVSRLFELLSFAKAPNWRTMNLLWSISYIRYTHMSTTRREWNFLFPRASSVLFLWRTLSTFMWKIATPSRVRAVPAPKREIRWEAEIFVQLVEKFVRCTVLWAKSTMLNAQQRISGVTCYFMRQNDYHIGCLSCENNRDLLPLDLIFLLPPRLTDKGHSRHSDQQSLKTLSLRKDITKKTISRQSKQGIWIKQEKLTKEQSLVDIRTEKETNAIKTRQKWALDHLCLTKSTSLQLQQESESPRQRRKCDGKWFNG